MPTTQENLKEAFAGESQANQKYRAFAKKAEREGPMRAVSFTTIKAAEPVSSEAAELFWRGVSRAPASVALRIVGVGALSPRWGGSFRQMAELQNSLSSSPLNEADKRYVSYRIYMDIADQERNIDKRHREAMRYAMLAHKACPSTHALWLASESGYDLEDWKVVRDLMNQYLEMEPGKPESKRRVETQVLHYDVDTWKAYNYIWNEEQTDAVYSERSQFNNRRQ